MSHPDEPLPRDLDVVSGDAAATVWLSVCVSGVEITRRSQSETVRSVGGH